MEIIFLAFVGLIVIGAALYSIIWRELFDMELINHLSDSILKKSTGSKI